MNKNAKAFLTAAAELFGDGAVIGRDDIQRVVNECGVPYPYWLVTKGTHRAGHGRYTLPRIHANQVVPVPSLPAPMPAAALDNATVTHLRQKKLLDETQAAHIEKAAGYVPFGFFIDLVRIVRSRKFFPVFITGLSGNGKTMMTEQVCAQLNRECIRVNISVETDESDLIGGPTLVEGNVVYREGPAITAMRRGSILLLDEVDRGSNKLMCLQGILEGKPYYIKKTGEMVTPAQGFNVIATANSKGRGSEDGKYLVQILDDAFLERFCITVEQSYPEPKTEKKILSFLINDENFIECLVQWADIVRQTYKQGAIDEIISTRRLTHIAEAFNIFNDRMMAIRLCVNRFDPEVKTAIIDLYTKVDASVNPPLSNASGLNPDLLPPNPTANTGEIPF